MKFTARKYILPFAQPLKTSTNIFRKREGIILSLASGNITALGEAAPLPGFSNESLPDVEKKLFQYRSEIPELFRSENPVQEMQRFIKKKNLPPSLEFGLDTLACDFEAKRQNIPLHQLLFGISSRPVAVNGLISLTEKPLLSTVQKLIDAGYKTIKLKVGDDFEHVLKQLHTIKKNFPLLTIRLDANQSWTLKDAINNLQALSSLSIEYCEEPLLDPSVNNYRRLANETKVPLAIDEIIYRKNNWQNFLPYISTVILKPMIIGSFTKNFATIALADTHVNRIIITTSLESGIGRSMTAVFASGKGTKESAHGLSTGYLFKNDFWDDNLYIENGNFHCPRQAGLGNVNKKDIKKFTHKLF